MSNEVGLSTGEVHEDDFSHAISEVPPEHQPLKITVYAKPKYDADQSVDLSSRKAPEPSLDMDQLEPRHYIEPIPVKEYSKQESIQHKKIEWGDIWESIKNDATKFGQGLVDSLTEGPKLMEKAYKGELTDDDAIKGVTNLALTFGMGGIATAPLREGAGMFGGRLTAKKEAQDTINSAVKDMAEGMPETKVYEKHGVYYGPDNQLRFEISDKDARLKTENLIESNLSPSKDGQRKFETPYPKGSVKNAVEEILSGQPHPDMKGPRTVGDILHHPELYEHYPWAKDIPLVSPGFDWSSLGFYSFDNKKIMVRGATEEQMKSTLLHEVNHAIQHHEGFARGGNPEEFLPKSEHYTQVKEGVKKLEKIHDQMWKEVEPAAEEFRKAFNHEVDGRMNKLVKDPSYFKDLSFRKAYNELNSMKSYSNPKYGNPKNKGDLAVENFVKQHYPDVYEATHTLKDAKGLLNSFEDHAFRQYEQLYGEYESRAVQDRIKWTDEERRAAPHWDQEQFSRTYPEGAVPDEAVKAHSKDAKVASSSSEGPEKIVKAAMKYPNGHIETGVTHALAHEDALNKGVRFKQGETYEEGFMTSKGRFVDRKEAKIIADREDQLSDVAKQLDKKRQTKTLDTAQLKNSYEDFVEATKGRPGWE